MLRLFVLEFVRVLRLQLRYPLEFISGLLLLTLLFYGLLIGAQHMTGVDSVGDSLDAIIIGYGTWIIVVGGLSQIPGDITGEAQRGTLESIFLAHYRVDGIFLARTLSGSLQNLVLTFAVVLLLLWLTERSVSFPPSAILAIFTTIIASISLGFLAGGLALKFKQVGRALVLAQYPLLFMMLTPFETMLAEVTNLSLLLPVVPSAITLRELTSGGKSLADSHIIAATVNAAAYLTLSMFLFNRYVRSVKANGLLAGH
jgi:ABC-2 type transport system permease protein